jgi:hypothetical protein
MMNIKKFTYIVFSLAAAGLFLAALFLLLSGAQQVAYASASNKFVKTSGSGSSCTQSSPCSLATALSTAASGDKIYIAAGTYTGSGAAVVNTSKSLTIYGGWDGTTTTPPVRDPVAYPTVLDAQDARRGVYIGPGATVTLEGFSVVDGSVVGNGGGLYARNVTLTLREMDFTSNWVTNTEYVYGGGAFVQGGTLLVEDSTFRANGGFAVKSSYGAGLVISATLAATVENCLFQDNDAWHGSGLYFQGGALVRPPFTLRNNTFVDNSGGYAGALLVNNAKARIEGNRVTGSLASNDYGAVSINSSDLLLTHNIIYGSESGKTAGLYLYNDSPFTVTNNIIAGNTSSWVQSPAVAVRKSSGKFLHNTVARNGSTYGFRIYEGASVVLTNNIVVSHTVGITVAAGSSAALNATLWGSGAWANGIDWDGAGTITTGSVNVWGEPAFMDPDNGDYHIRSNSAAKDAGVNAGVTTDIDGDTRPVGTYYDIGADEFSLRRIYLPLVKRGP